MTNIMFCEYSVPLYHLIFEEKNLIRQEISLLYLGENVVTSSIPRKSQIREISNIKLTLSLIYCIISSKCTCYINLRINPAINQIILEINVFL